MKETDYAGQAGGLPLRFERQYNSKIDPLAESVGMGWGWRHTFSRSLVLSDVPDAGGLPRVRVLRPDGAGVVFQQQADGSYTQDADVNDRLVAIKSNQVITGYQFTQADGAEGVGVVETYDAGGRLQSLKTLGGWTQTFAWSTDTTSTDIAPRAGLLISVTDSSGRQLQFKYNEGGQVRQLIDPAGKAYDYAYDGSDNLVSVTNPRLEVRTFHYNEADHIQDEGGSYGNAGETRDRPHALTGITDEATKRYADYYYQFDGRGVQTTHALGADKHQLTYNADGSTTVVDPLNQSRNYQFAVTQGVAQPKDQDQPCSTGSPYKSVKSDANGNPEYQVDFNGNRTSFVYDTVRNLEKSRTEGLTATGAVTADSRTITTEWHATLRLPAKVAQPLKLTTYEYNPNGTLKSLTEQATTDKDGSKGLSPTLDAAVPSRKWSYTYNTEGQVLGVDGPRTDLSDISTLEYYTSTDTAVPPKYRKGDLKLSKNALGHTTNYTDYDQHGNVLKATDANNLATAYTYDALGRVDSKTVGGLKTSYTYDKRGMLESVTGPQGGKLTYAYDDAHRLKTITDRDGNRTEYTELDAMGNRKDERVYEVGNKLVRQHTRKFNALNRLEQDIGGTTPAKQITQYAYHLGGQLKQVLDPLSRVTDNTYDALNRLKTSTLPVPDTNVARPVISYGYDGQDRLASVTDPRLLKTSYVIDGLGNRQSVSSPDTGVQTTTPDAAGNVKTARDTKGQSSTYTYDALNRVTEVLLHDGSKQQYQYDTGANAKGRLNQIKDLDAGGATLTTLDIGYDTLGRVSKQSRTIAGKTFDTQYLYDSLGRLDTLTYPSGRTLKYSYDTSGRVSAVNTTPSGGAPVSVVSSVKYHAFGGVSQFTYGNGQTHSRGQNLDGKPSGYMLGAATYAVDYDDADQIKTIRDTGNVSQTNAYGFDGIGRLKSATLPAATYAYQYDGVGNRNKYTVGGSASNYGFPADKNWLTTVGAQNQAFDLNGSLQSSPAGTFTHDTKGRLSKLVAAGNATTNYVVDAQGLRVRKSNAQGDVVYIHDDAGKLIAESAPNGTVLKEYLYLGELPVAVVAQ